MKEKVKEECKKYIIFYHFSLSQGIKKYCNYTSHLKIFKLVNKKLKKILKIFFYLYEDDGANSNLYNNNHEIHEDVKKRFYNFSPIFSSFQFYTFIIFEIIMKYLNNNIKVERFFRPSTNSSY